MDPPRILVIGAGSRGNAYARAISQSSSGQVVAVADPVSSKRRRLGRKYIWGEGQATEGQEFEDWKDFVAWEHDRRARSRAGRTAARGVDGILVCTLDESHADIIVALAPLGLHVLSEKPLATTLTDCLAIYRALLGHGLTPAPTSIFAVGHVLRYSPHNLLLRKLLLEDKVIGDIVSIEHTEPVGWWHFSHSYVRCAAAAPVPARDLTDGEQRQLAGGAPDRPLLADQGLPRHRSAAMAALLAAAWIT